MQEWTGAARLGDALVMTARRLPEARWLICTQVHTGRDAVKLHESTRSLGCGCAVGLQKI